mmetsp:Transcript_34786/g.65500  ORF Transcript_34786/g.65500 Transcript_34786/m.65500 type:complete len:282 (+) Transcript_34786:402-1247(+)
MCEPGESGPQTSFVGRAGRLLQPVRRVLRHRRSCAFEGEGKQRCDWPSPDGGEGAHGRRRKLPISRGPCCLQRGRGGDGVRDAGQRKDSGPDERGGPRRRTRDPGDYIQPIWAGGGGGRRRAHVRRRRRRRRQRQPGGHRARASRVGQAGARGGGRPPPCTQSQRLGSVCGALVRHRRARRLPRRHLLAGSGRPSADEAPCGDRPQQVRLFRTEPGIEVVRDHHHGESRAGVQGHCAAFRRPDDAGIHAYGLAGAERRVRAPPGQAPGDGDIHLLCQSLTN